MSMLGTSSRMQLLNRANSEGRAIAPLMVSLFSNPYIMADTINIMSMNNVELSNHLTELGIKVKEDEKRSTMIKMYGEWKKKHAEQEEKNVEQEV